MNTVFPEITINACDAERLRHMLDHLPPTAGAGEQLEREMDRARLVPPDRVPPHIVTMRSVVRFHLSTIDQTLDRRLVYPRELHDPASEVSVLSPVGAALLGLSAGDSIDWPLPDGRCARITVHAVLYQPESQGEYWL